MSDRFAYDEEGCRQATEFLREHGKLDDFYKYGDGGSTDGYTLTAVANSLAKKLARLLVVEE